jgi:hypothetical protein
MRLTSLTLFGAGYVLGSRAGRQRYEQMVALGARVARILEQKSARDRIVAYADGGKPLFRVGGVSSAFDGSEGTEWNGLSSVGAKRRTRR